MASKYFRSYDAIKLCNTFSRFCANLVVISPKFYFSDITENCPKSSIAFQWFIKGQGGRGREFCGVWCTPSPPSEKYLRVHPKWRPCNSDETARPLLGRSWWWFTGTWRVIQRNFLQIKHVVYYVHLAVICVTSCVLLSEALKLFNGCFHWNYRSS